MCGRPLMKMLIACGLFFTACATPIAAPFTYENTQTLAAKGSAVLDWSETHPAERGEEVVYQIDGREVPKRIEGALGPQQALLSAGTHSIRFGGPGFLYDTTIRLKLSANGFYKVYFVSTGGGGGLYLGASLVIIGSNGQSIYQEPLVINN